MLDLITSGDARDHAAHIIFGVLFVAAMIWGGGPERAVAIVWLVVFELSGPATDFLFGSGRELASIDPFSAGRDLVAGGLWIGIALYANRNYTLWVAAMQILAIFGHLSRGLSEIMSPIAYQIMIEVPAWSQLLLLAIGLTRHILRKRKYGAYRDWRVTKNMNANRASSGQSILFTSVLSGNSGTWRDELK